MSPSHSKHGKKDRGKGRKPPAGYGPDMMKEKTHTMPSGKEMPGETHPAPKKTTSKKKR